MLAKSTSFSHTEQQLLNSAEKGDIASVRRLLKDGANIEAKDLNGDTPLGLAAEFDHLATVKFLLDKGANIETQDKSRETPLIEAARSANTSVVALLLQKGVNVQDKKRALFVTTESEPLIIGMPSTAEQSASQGNQNSSRAAQFTPPSYPGTVRLLLDSGVDIEAKEEGDDATPLIVAASHGQTDTVELLLERGAKIEAKDNVGDTPLIAAACDCAVIDMPDTFNAINLLLQKGADIGATNKKGTTALMRAADWGRSEIVKLLLEKGANVEAKDHDGDVKLLLEHGADARIKDKHGATALSLATKSGNTRAIQLLKRAVAKSL